MTIPLPPSPPGDRLALLYQLSQAFNSTLDLNQVLNRVIDEVILTMNAERGFVMLNDEEKRLAFRVARGIDQQTIADPRFHVSLSVAERVAREGKPILTSDAQTDSRFSMRQSVMLFGLRSILCVPLTIKENILGVIYVDNRMRAGMFTSSDLELLSAIASNAAIAIENARLYQVAVEKGRLEHELQMARQVQFSMLPTTTPHLPGWEYGAYWKPARQVAGDYYDYILAKNGQLGLVIADVTDKGMPAALFMALTRNTVRASLDSMPTPEEGITQANRIICADSTSGMFVTLFYAQLSADSNEITYINAGHNPPLLYKSNAQAEQERYIELDRTGMALGVFPDEVYGQKCTQLDPGDILLLYTDGVTEALNPNGEEFGLERLQEIILEYRHTSPGVIITALEQAINAFIGPEAPFDDITILIVKRV